MRGLVWTGSAWREFGAAPAAPAWAHAVHQAGGAVSTVLGASGAPGAWVPVEEVLSADASWLTIQIASNPATGASMEIEVGVGAAGAEVAVGSWRAYRLWGGGNAGATVASLPIPRIPAGSRVAVRASGTPAGGTSVDWQVTLGASTAVPSGLTRWAATMAPHPTTPAWVEVSAATATALSAVHVSATSDGVAAVGGVVEVGVGAAGTEQAVGSVAFVRSSGGWTIRRSEMLLHAPVPAGSRLVVRCWRTAGSSSPDVPAVIHGVHA